MASPHVSHVGERVRWIQEVKQSSWTSASVPVHLQGRHHVAGEGRSSSAKRQKRQVLDIRGEVKRGSGQSGSEGEKSGA